MLLLARRLEAWRVTKAVYCGVSVCCSSLSRMDSTQQKQQHHSQHARHRQPHATSGNPQHNHRHHHHHHHSHQSYHSHPYPSHPPHPHYHQDFSQPPPPHFLPPAKSPSFLGPMASAPTSLDYHHGRPKSGGRDRQQSSHHHHHQTNWSHSGPPHPSQDHPLAPHHVPWGVPPPDDRWGIPPPPHHHPPFPPGGSHHFPAMPPGPGMPIDPALLQQDGRHSTRYGMPPNFKPMDMFQQQTRGYSSGAHRGHGSEESSPRGGQVSQNGVAGLTHHSGGDRRPMEHLSEGKSYKRPKTGASPSRPPRSHAPLRPMVEVNKSLKLKHTTNLSILSYNLLAQSLLEKNRSLYGNGHPDHLDWDYRKEGLLRELSQSAADILCLQEVQHDHYHDWFQPELSKLGYSGVFVQRTGEHQDGCATFYKQSKLRLTDWLGLKYRRNFKVLNRDNVALLAKMELVEGGNGETCFCVANTHLLFNPKAGEVKLAQLAYLFAELYKMASNSGLEEQVPILLCGDFNSLPHSPLVNFVTSSSLDYSDLSAIVIAGYYDEATKKKRAIPKPLLPFEMAIRSNCTYKPMEPCRNSEKDVQTQITSAASDCTIGEHESSKRQAEKEQQVQLQPKTTVNSEKSSELSASRTRSEFKEESMTVDQPCLRLMRSARGRKPIGHSTRYNGVLDIPGVDSLLQSNLSPGGEAVKRTRDHLSADDLKSFKSASSGASSVDDMALETRGKMEVDESISVVSMQDCQSQASEDSLSERQHHRNQLPNDTSKKSSATIPEPVIIRSNGNTSKVSKDLHPEYGTANGEEKLGVLSHPFKLTPAYPHPNQWKASTVTTYHNAAFETVDYIFFSPMTYRLTRTGKKQLCGFHLLQRQVLPSTHTLLDLGPQPHQFLSSDHLLLKATLQFTW